MDSRKRAAGRPAAPSCTPKSLPATRPGYHGVFRVISPADCFELLETGGVGRVGFSTADGVIVLPVNFVVSDKTIVFRTAPDTLLALHADARLSFEVDHVDAAVGAGWSVLVRGHAHQVTDECDVKYLENSTALQPWAPGARATCTCGSRPLTSAVEASRHAELGGDPCQQNGLARFVSLWVCQRR